MLAVVDHRIPTDAKIALERLGHRVLTIPPHPGLPAPVCGHPDMLLFFAPDAVFCTKSYHKIAQKELKQISACIQKPIRETNAEVSEIYPNDILLNAAPVGSFLFCHTQHTARELLLHEGYECVKVRQGYAKCSVVPVGDHALITEDASIANAARHRGLDVLRVRSNAVTLPGYDTGFLGGSASFSPVSESRRILFCGNLDLHPDAEEIKAFCQAHGSDPISLSDSQLTDVGTIFLLPMGVESIMEKEKIARINALAKKKKEVGLTEEELAEQAALRQEYLKDFRAQFGSVLDNTVIQYPDGSRTSLPDMKKKN